MVRTLAYAADLVSRRRGVDSRAALISRWKHEITIQILRRRAAMVKECLPRLGVNEIFIMEGADVANSAPLTGTRSEGKALLLEDDDDDSLR